MNKIKEATQYLNADQIPVVTADQPLFAMAKQIQWQWPEFYLSLLVAYLKIADGQLFRLKQV